MSASPITSGPPGSKAIPVKKVLISDSSELPPYYSSTPGGTMFSSTPGGTKIVYEKSVLMALRNSPISNSPPSYNIPFDLAKDFGNTKCDNKKRNNGVPPRRNSQGQKKLNNDYSENQFHIEL